MAIEFRCGNCSKLLRVSDEAAGRQARCPQCGAVSDVPMPGSAETPQAGLAGGGWQPPSSSEPSSPFGSPPPGGGSWQPPSGSGPSSPFGSPSPWQGAPESSNPYQAPSQYTAPVPAGPDPDARGKLLGPAIGLIVTGALGVLISGFFGVAVLAAAADMGGRQGFGQPPPQIFMVLYAGFYFLLAIVGGLMIFGAIKMKNLDSFGWAMATAILALLPCCHSGVILGIPFGIWALIVLFDPSVKSAFRN